jgi:putative endonuclease
MTPVTKRYWVYIRANEHPTVLYVGVTNDLLRRATEHRERNADGFTKQYNVTRLVWYQEFERVDAAIAFEKRLKAGSRAGKIARIEEQNPEWRDLYEELREAWTEEP